MIKRDYSEKRDFIRMTINTPAKIILERSGDTAEGVCNDLSGSGMLLTVDDMLPVNSELTVTLMPEGSAEPMLEARCSVARSLKAADNKCLLGLEIMDIIDDNKRAMAS